jgi:hypothetical protein
MIPKELQKQLDDFTKKWETHFAEKVKKLASETSDMNNLIQRYNEDFKKTDVSIISKEDWKLLSGWLGKADSLLLEMQEENGRRCIQCQGWIEEKLKEAPKR